MVLTAVAGCAQHVDDSPALEGESRGMAAALVEDRLARTAPADAITVRYNNVLKLWVFACDAEHNLRRRVKTISQGTWGSWTTVASGCQGAPAAVKWASSAATEQVFVYFRGTDGNLYEVAYDSDGSSDIADMSSYTGFGGIRTDPVLVNVEPNKIALAVTNLSLQLHTLDYYWGGWHVHPVLKLDGTTPIETIRPVVGHFSNAEAGADSYLAAWATTSGYVAKRGPAYNANYVQTKATFGSLAQPAFSARSVSGTRTLHVFRVFDPAASAKVGRLESAVVTGTGTALSWVDVRYCTGVNTGPAFRPSGGGLGYIGTDLRIVDTRHGGECLGNFGNADSAPRMFDEDGLPGHLYESTSGSLIYGTIDGYSYKDLGLDVRE
jgi:hypothetical protein